MLSFTSPEVDCEKADEGGGFRLACDPEGLEPELHCWLLPCAQAASNDLVMFSPWATQKLTVR